MVHARLRGAPRKATPDALFTEAAPDHNGFPLLLVSLSFLTRALAPDSEYSMPSRRPSLSDRMKTMFKKPDAPDKAIKVRMDMPLFWCACIHTVL